MIVATITKKERKLLDDYHACQHACEKVIKKVVREHELSEIQIQEWWRAVLKKYNLKQDRRKAFRVEGDEITAYDPLEEEVEKLLIRHQVGSHISKQVMEVFEIKD